MENVAANTSGVAEAKKPVIPPCVLEMLEEVHIRVNHGAAAMTLWEKYFTPAERQKLGGDVDASFAKHRGAVGMWMEVHDLMSQPRAILQLGKRLGLLDEINYHWLDREISAIDPWVPPAKRKAERPRDDDSDPDVQLDAAVTEHALVLVRGQGEARVYWNGSRVDVDWSKKRALFELLWTLVEKALVGSVVGWDEVTSNGNPKVIVHRKRRLKDFLPKELVSQISSAGETSYRLNLDRDQMKLIQLEVGQYLAM